ncbi:O-acyltransferase WSD1-like [Chenopodium quinoa]|uniref:Diacylglycerol O-acyltransferase n=1 Tax=Chenopodium quinoa TaxID=63459 RepID=A0A803MLY0_CHEQI|nr:O-acyltransferase WSD1-like [Chenopodium quinoa]
MEITKLRVSTKAKSQKNLGFDEELEPVSPTTEYFLTEGLTIYALCFFELAVSTDFPSVYAFLNDVFINAHPRFSSIPVEDKRGKKKWKKVEVNIKDLVVTPVYPEGLSIEDYSKHFDDYISKISTSQIPQDKPLWQLHIFNYPTKNAAATFIFKFHHAIADGTSLMGVLYSCYKQVDDPSKPLTFPSRTTPREKQSHSMKKVFNIVPKFIASIFYTFLYFGQSIKLSYLEDDRTPIRSGNTEMNPDCRICTVNLSLTDIKRIKSTLGVTVNDVVVGILFLGTRLYMQEINNGLLKNTRSTVVITLNIRSDKGYARVEEMWKHNAKVPWGNRFSGIEIPITNLEENDIKNPLKFILKAHKIIKKKRNAPFAQILLLWCLGVVRTCVGLQAAAKTFEQRSKNCSFLMSNMIGPIEKMSFAGHPVDGFYFMPTGLKSSLTVTVMSYMQMLTIGLAVEKGFIDHQKLITCVEKAFQLIFDAATTTS